MPAIPIIALGVSAASAGATAYQQHKAGQLQKQAYEQQAAFGKKQEGLMDLGTPMLSAAGGYYQKLLTGNRNLAAQATAGPRAAITDQYRGAERGITHAGIRGGVREQALAELSRDRASKIASLTTGVQPMAAEGVGRIGSAFLGEGVGAGSVYGNLLKSSTDRYNTASEDASKAGGAMGSLLFDLLKYYKKPDAGAGLA